MGSLLDEEFNPKRKKALQKIEDNQKPGNIELGILGLTTYFDEETLDDSLFEKVLFADNEGRKIHHILNKNFYFMPLQQEALNFIDANERSMLLAPTSFGKTMIVKEYIFLNKPNIIAYIVPTNALGYELESSFKNNDAFSDYLIFDKETAEASSESSEQKLFFIGTQEKYLEIKDGLPHIDLFVIDEAYKLEEKTTLQRGYKLSKSFLDTIDANADKIILLCPSANVIGFDEYGFSIYKTNFNAVDKEYHLLPKESFFEELNGVVRKEKTILYCPNPAVINNSCSKIISVTEPDKKLLYSLKNDFHKEWSVVKYFEKGILVHHGQMPKYVQNKMIKAFIGNQNYKLLVGTNSISEGINTPTKNIFIHPDTDCANHKMLIKNTVGRAGRLGVIPIGHIYSTEDIESMESEEVDIVLSVFSEEGSEELSDILDETKLNMTAQEYCIDLDFLKELIKETKMSLRTIRAIFDALMKHRDFDDLSTITYMAKEVFEEYNMAWMDYIMIKGVLQSFYYGPNREQIPLNTYSSKIAFFRCKYKGSFDLSDNDIIDGYMRFLYSSLDNYLLVIANIAKRLFQTYADWPFGNNVKSIINSFLQKYYTKIYGVEDFDSFSAGSQKVIQALREYGILLTDSYINRHLIEEIESKLNVRYSMFDIMKVIKDIANSDSIHSKTCAYLIEKYF